ncbi:protease FtsH subunit HflC [Litorimonas taeanensis]|uniref:Protein HflC n=1 Tax=Litorimonas taeanensis TaxID=568099 RepID=A0A420WKY3_9PROT|nr:protease modulator HflC [Litorimonas taeanensis]RKQ71674.1 protease FtsH subunit HflC [Litorimonas taeanensis]
MNNNRLMGLGIVLAIFAFIASQCFYTVREDKQALVLRFGEPVRTENAYGIEEDAGLKFKVPVMESVRFYDRKNLVLDLEGQPILASDQERLVVDAFIRYRITDVRQFYEAFNTRVAAEIQMKNILDSLIRDTLGSVESPEIISGQRVNLMNAIEDRANARAETGRFGLRIEDVRIKRADLPNENASRVFNRMSADRQEQSAEKRGEGERSKRTIIAEADKDVQILIANARKQSEIIKGEGDKQRNRIYADAYNLDPEFFAFYRSMEAYKKGLGKKSTYVLSPDSDFLGYLDDQGGR